MRSPVSPIAVLLPLLAVGALAGCAAPARLASSPAGREAATSAGTSVSAIRAVLDGQRRAWNAGDLRGFMDGYWRSDSLRFASGGTVRRGWQAALDGYLRGYPSREAMGTLTFSDLEFSALTPTTATVFGRWRLDYAGATPPSGGLFTLGFRRIGADWRIASDHTSSNDR